MRRTPRKLIKHAESIAYDQNVVIAWDDKPYNADGQYNHNQRVVRVNGNSPYRYLVAMHELGHVPQVDNGLYGRREEDGNWIWTIENVLNCEAEAWDYAFKNSIITPPKTWYMYAAKCLDTYLGACNYDADVAVLGWFMRRLDQMRPIEEKYHWILKYTKEEYAPHRLYKG